MVSVFLNIMSSFLLAICVSTRPFRCTLSVSSCFSLTSFHSLYSFRKSPVELFSYTPHTFLFLSSLLFDLFKSTLDILGLWCSDLSKWANHLCPLTTHARVRDTYQICRWKRGCCSLMKEIFWVELGKMSEFPIAGMKTAHKTGTLG